MANKQEINKLISEKIESAECSEEIKDFLKDIFTFERDYFNEDLARYSAQYKKLTEYYLKKVKNRK